MTTVHHLFSVSLSLPICARSSIRPFVCLFVFQKSNTPCGSLTFVHVLCTILEQVAKQREQYKLLMKGEHSFLTPDRKQQLEEIGFVWSMKGRAPKEVTMVAKPLPADGEADSKPTTEMDKQGETNDDNAKVATMQDTQEEDGSGDKSNINGANSKLAGADSNNEKATDKDAVVGFNKTKIGTSKTTATDEVVAAAVAAIAAVEDVDAKGALSKLKEAEATDASKTNDRVGNNNNVNTGSTDKASDGDVSASQNGTPTDNTNKEADKDSPNDQDKDTNKPQQMKTEEESQGGSAIKVSV